MAEVDYTQTNQCKQAFSFSTKVIAEFIGTCLFTFVIGCSEGDHYVPMALFTSLLLVGSKF